MEATGKKTVRMPAMSGRTVLLVEPWMMGSHAAWARGYQQHSRHEVRVLEGIPQSWRATFDQSASQLASRVAARPDVVLASSMFDLSTFLSDARLTGVPVVLYFHENQLTYDRAAPDLQRGAVNWQSSRAADQVVFNSQFHLDDFHGALPQLGLAASVIESARQEALVLPVGIDPPAPRREPCDRPAVVWNHRWEHDKDPDAFVAAVADAGVDCDLILLGEGKRSADYHRRLEGLPGVRIPHAGFAKPDRYRELLATAELVVSTARQEFFGVAVAEAMAAGAAPLVPDRLAYPELLGPDLAEGLYQPGTLATRLRAALTSPGQLGRLQGAAMARAAGFFWERVAPRYDDLVDSIT